MEIDRYNFKIIEEKWQDYWNKNKTFKAIIKKNKKKILLSGNVSLSIRKDTHGTRKELYNW